MKTIKNLVRKNIVDLKAYRSARDEFNGKDGVFLDANENPFGPLNRYPDSYQSDLKNTLAALKKIENQHLFIGNGSDEVIDLAIRIFCNPGKDKIIICPPTYGMYEVAANINDVKIERIELDENFQLKTEKIISSNAKMVFICSPNNPTGNDIDGIQTIIENFNGIVFIDEAYIDFSSKPSLVEKIKKHPNIIVSQTLSKAWGRAAIRIGVAYASAEIINYFNKVKAPYNVSSINQVEAIRLLQNVETFNLNLNRIIKQKEWLIKKLLENDLVSQIYPSATNFLLVKVKDANLIYQKLIKQKLIVRNRNTVIENTLRITVGTEEENEKLIELLKKIENEKSIIY